MKKLIAVVSLLLAVGCAPLLKAIDDSNTVSYRGDAAQVQMVVHLSENQSGSDGRIHNWQTVSVVNPYRQSIVVELRCSVFNRSLTVPARSERFILSEGPRPAQPGDPACRIGGWSFSG